MKSDLTGKRFGRLTVVSCSAEKKYGRRAWVCLCDCGKQTTVTTSDLKANKISSCGCYRKDVSKNNAVVTHGLTQTRLYRMWGSMVQRCYNSKAPAYKRYGGRGISICDEWRNSFQSFHDWAFANGYDEAAERGQCTLDRIDVNGNYCPENCRWITIKEQQSNRRTNRLVEYRGKTYTLKQLAQKLNLCPATLANRINNGWAEDEYSLPVNLGNSKIRREKA